MNEDEIAALTTERGEVYGSPGQDFVRIKRMHAAWKENHRPLLAPADEDILDHAIYMICVKLSRLAHSGTHKDSWDDIQGYADCAKQALGLAQ